MAKSQYVTYTHAELVEEITKLNKRKKYGLVWEEEKTKEKFEAEAKGKLPVVTEDKKREINGDAKNPTHILIEGDNYHALSVLNYTHSKSIDVMYFDPPYNTGNNDFKYNDKFVDDEDSYRHSKWLSFMSKRLILAKKLLKDDGVIFLSIGDDEYAQLKLLCDEIFHPKNFLANITRKQKETSNKGRYFSPSTDYILAYASHIESLSEFNDVAALTKKEYLKLFKYEDKRGKYNIVSLYMPSLDPMRGCKNQRYYIECPDGSLVIPPENIYPKKIIGKTIPPETENDKVWRWIPETFEKHLKDNRVVFLETKTSPLINEKGKQAKWNIYTKIYLHERQESGMKPLTFVDFPNSQGSKELIKMNIDFANSKPKDLISYLISITNKSNQIKVLTIFAGSGTTLHSVLELNNLDNGKRQCILVTNNENNISTEICYPRIKKAIHGYKTPKDEKVEGLGGNLKYYKTNFVGSEPTHRNKKLLTEKSIEMLCIRENTFEEVLTKPDIAIFKSEKKYTAILFNEMKMEEFKREIKKMKLKVSVYVFSLEGDDFSENFQDLKNAITLCSIPEAILKVYRRIYETAKQKK